MHWEHLLSKHCKTEQTEPLRQMSLFKGWPTTTCKKEIDRYNVLHVYIHS